MKNKETITYLTDELIDQGVLDLWVPDNYEVIADGEACTEEKLKRINPLDYADDVRQELIQRRARGLLKHNEFKEVMKALDEEVEWLTRAKRKTDRIINGVLDAIERIGRSAA
ncbi:hypothetical protein [Nitratifractor salsuginis]|uniref:Uncharacterized protein n=1 Tax=Nitratifractor salsuginis (strain DSM 16511 / JCM 12458 / E9I37-1) TaxID=749222 RepID=E6X1R6_NITSE|nr:hypothetical protein [Nitratifractor salsuginis]ADV47057.1 hypothetical protein Nitsa_1812 [Nitratifractor salsuginis DSM 16511]